MNKKGLVDAVAEKLGNITKKEVEEFVNAFTETVAEVMKNDDKVQLVGFGTFEAQRSADREGRNPKTGETITIKGKKTPKFKAGKALKEAVND